MAQNALTKLVGQVNPAFASADGNKNLLSQVMAARSKHNAGNEVNDQSNKINSLLG